MKFLKKKLRADIPVSVSIITKNRPDDIVSLCTSLETQTVLPDEFIIVDSSTNRKTQKLISAFKKRVPFPIRYIYEPRPGFPVARNRVLKKSRNSWVAFTDDDCITDPSWLFQIKSSISKHPLSAAIAGESKSWYPKNIFSLATMFNETRWKSKVRRGERILDLETLDNKNVAYNLSFFRMHKITYDEKRGGRFFGASDDCDLGMQIYTHDGKAFYNKRMIVYHKDLITLEEYTKRLVIRSLAHATYETKWYQVRKNLRVPRNQKMRFMTFFKHFCRTNKLNLWMQFLLMTLLTYTTFLVKCVKLYIRVQSDT